MLCHVNNIPDELELHDIGIIFSVLTHIRDPYTSLLRMCSHVNEKMVITQLGGYEMRDTLFNLIPKFFRKLFAKKKQPIWEFLPRSGKIGSSWWSFNEEAIIRMLELFGFEKLVC